MKKINPINILLFLVIIVLLSFIIVPPVLRATIKDVNLSNDNSHTVSFSNLSVLSCEKLDTINLYKITSRSRYKEDFIEQNTIKYEKLDAIEETVSNEKSSLKTPEEEIQFFSSINGIDVRSEDNITTVTIIKAAVQVNTANDTLLKYFNAKDKQKEFYENQGYTCEEIKN